MATKRELAAWLEETRICAFRAKLELLYPATDGEPGPEVRVVDVDAFIDGVAATCAIFEAYARGKAPFFGGKELVDVLIRQYLSSRDDRFLVS